MERFFFDSEVDAELVVDEAGREFSSVEAVRQFALEALGDVAKDAIRQGATLIAIAVKNEAGDLVFCARASITMQSLSDLA